MIRDGQYTVCLYVKNNFIQQGSIKLIESDIYTVTEYFYFK